MTYLTFFDLLMIFVGSQVGSACFFMPASLNRYGFWSTAGIVLSGMAILAFSFVLDKLEQIRLEKNNDLMINSQNALFKEKLLLSSSAPASYIGFHLGYEMGSFCAWVYWFVAWFSSIPLLSMIVNSFIEAFLLQDFLNSLGIPSSVLHFVLSTLFLLILSFINYKGIDYAAALEKYLNIFKGFCFIVLPLIGLFLIVTNRHAIDQSVFSGDFNGKWHSLIKTSTLSLWGFLGVETITSFRESVSDSGAISKTLILGTILVTSIYLLNNIVFLLFAGTNISDQNSPYIFLLNTILQNHYTKQIMAFLTMIVIMSTMNAWIISIAQISHHSAKARFFQSCFLNQNKKNSFYSIFIPSFGMILINLFTLKSSATAFLDETITISVLLFVWIYFFCCLSLIKFLMNNPSANNRLQYFALSFFSVFFFSLCLGDNGLKKNILAILCPLLFFIFSKGISYCLSEDPKLYQYKTNENEDTLE